MQPTRASGAASRIRTVVVLRALPGLGDFLCAVPTLRAIRRRLPGATIHLIGLADTAPLARRFGACVDRFHPFPGLAGLPEQPPPPDAVLERFVGDVRSLGADLAIQLHGSGEIVNELVCAFAARTTAGFRRPGSPAPGDGCFLDWDDAEPEVLRGLRLLAALGILDADEPGRRDVARLELPFAADARERIDPVLARRPGPYAVLHPGSSRPESRWDPAGFAAAGRVLDAAGIRVVVTGDRADAPLASQVASLVPNAVDLGGRTDLDALAALVDGARLVVTNDTGMSHVAAALAVPSIVVFRGVGPDHVRRWAPLDRTRHVPVPAERSAVLEALDRVLTTGARAA